MAIGSGYAIIISVKNLPPVAFDDSVGTNMGVALTFDPLINDFDQDTFPTGNISIDTYDSSSINGSTISVNPSKTSFTYTPKVNFFGFDTFTYQVTDGAATSNVATVTVAVSCLPPIQQPKSFDLTESTTYSFDITNVNCAPNKIVFSNNLPDRDINTPKQNISIVRESVVASSNLIINSITDTVINFTTKALGTGKEIGISYIYYDIINSVCNFTNKDKASVAGSTNSSSVRVVQGFLGEVINEDSVPASFTKYPMFDRGTGQYPISAVGWFVFCFDTKKVPDQYYISTISKPYKNSSNVWTTDKNFYGLIGPIGDDLGPSLDGNGRFLFFKPYGHDLNIWGKTDAGSSAYRIGCVQLFKPSITDKQDPNRYFSDPQVKPTDAQVLACINTINENPFNATINDYTNVFTGTDVPPFISII